MRITPKEIHLTPETGSTLFPDGRADYIYDLGSFIKCPLGTAMNVSLVRAEFPISYYNVDAPRNVFRYKYDSDVERAVTFEPGNYSVQQLLEALNSALVAQNPDNPIALSWNSRDNKVSLRGAGTREIHIQPTSTCLKILGFSDKPHSGNLVTSDLMVDVRGPTSLLIHSDLISDTHTYSGSGMDTQRTLARVPITAGVYGTNVYEPFTPLPCEIVKRFIKRFRVQVQTPEGDPVYFHGMSFTITLRISFEAADAAVTSGYAGAATSGAKPYGYAADQHKSLRDWIDAQLAMQKNVM